VFIFYLPENEPPGLKEKPMEMIIITPIVIGILVYLTCKAFTWEWRKWKYRSKPIKFGTSFEPISVNSPYRNTMRQAFIAYMNSDMWKGVRDQVIYRDGGLCRKCNHRGKVVHHKCYRYWGMGNSAEVRDCMLLCSSCHDVEHSSGNVSVPFFAKRNYE